MDNRVRFNDNTLDRFIGYIVFAERGHQRTMEIMMLIKNIGKSVKFMGSKYIQESLINMSLQLYISHLNKHIVTLHNVSLRLVNKRSDVLTEVHNSPEFHLI